MQNLGISLRENFKILICHFEFWYLHFAFVASDRLSVKVSQEIALWAA